MSKGSNRRPRDNRYCSREQYDRRYAAIKGLGKKPKRTQAKK